MTHEPKDRGKVTQSCVDAAYAQVEVNLAGHRPTARQRQEAARYCVPPASPVDDLDEQPRLPWLFVAAAVFVLLVLILS